MHSPISPSHSKDTPVTVNPVTSCSDLIAMPKGVGGKKKKKIDNVEGEFPYSNIKVSKNASLSIENKLKKMTHHASKKRHHRVSDSDSLSDYRSFRRV